jgi:hypothetical protein
MEEAVLIINPDVEDPLVVPLAAFFEKVIAPLKVSIFPFKLILPLVCLNTVETYRLFPKVSVFPTLFNITVPICDPPVIYIEFVIVVAVIERVDVEVPLILPVPAAEGKIAVPVSESIFVLKSSIPFVCVKVPPTVKGLPIVIMPAPPLLTAKLLTTVVPEKVSVPKLPVPPIDKFALVPPTKVPDPVKEPFKVNVVVVLAFTLKDIAVPTSNVPETDVFVVVPSVFVPEPERIRLP